MSRVGAGFWTAEKIKLEVMDICASTGEFPTTSTLNILRRSDLLNAIRRYYDGGLEKLCIDLGFSRKKKFLGKWTKDQIKIQAKQIADDLGYFPSTTQLRETGHNDLNSAVSKYYEGGFHQLARDVGYEPFQSATLIGWKGEDLAEEILISKGYSVKRMKCKDPYDILINDLVRVDVKVAKYAEYGVSKGWFYRIAKVPSSDIVMFVRSDEKDAYILPHYCCPNTNLTISKTGGAHKNYYNNYSVIDFMLKNRLTELEKYPKINYGGNS